MLCKDCVYFKEWVAIHTATCEKTRKPVETSGRPCDDFVYKKQLTDEWGESNAPGTCKC